jgi:hypothetical protein
MAGGNTAVASGVGALGAGVDQARSIFDIAKGGIGGIRDYNQAPIDEQKAQWEFQTQAPFAGLKNFWDIVGSNNWGGASTSTGSGTQTASPASVIGGLMTAAGSFLKPPVPKG